MSSIWVGRQLLMTGALAAVIDLLDRGALAVIPPLMILFVSLWVLRIPFAVLLLARWGADAIWWSFPLGSLASVALSVAYYRVGGWRGARML